MRDKVLEGRETMRLTMVSAGWLAAVALLAFSGDRGASAQPQSAARSVPGAAQQPIETDGSAAKAAGGAAKKESKRAAAPSVLRTLSKPKLAPPWHLADSSGTGRSSEEQRGKWTLLVMNRGLGCPHCAQQLSQLSAWKDNFNALGVDIVAIAPVADARQIRASGLRVPILVDPSKAVFQEYGCDLPTDVLHGLFLIDPTGKIRSQSVKQMAEENVEGIYQAVRSTISAEGARKRKA